MSQWMREFTPGRTQSTNENLLADVVEFAADSFDECGQVAPLFVAVAARRAWMVPHLAINAQHFGHFSPKSGPPRSR